MLHLCDFGHEVKEDVRILPVDGDKRIIICKDHYLQEMEFRHHFNKSAPKDFKYEVPNWDDLEMFNG